MYTYIYIVCNTQTGKLTKNKGISTPLPIKPKKNGTYSISRSQTSSKSIKNWKNVLGLDESLHTSQNSIGTKNKRK